MAQNVICLVLLVISSLINTAHGDCQNYNNNIFCQNGVTNCITCKAGGDENNGLPCAGVRLKLFSTDDDFCGWCPDTCVPFIEEGGRCWQTISGAQVHGMCGPWLTCQKQAGDQFPTCAKMKTDCLDAQAKYDQDLNLGLLGMDQRRPVCDDDGFWGPVQCTGADVCRCVNKKTGHPIHGVETNMTTAVDSMTCACAREADELKEIGCSMSVKYDGPASRSVERFDQDYTKCIASRESYFPGHLRCLPNGNYDTAQCIEQTTDAPNNPGYALENCFCYYEGKPFNSSLAPINIAHIVLECHETDDMHFEGFYRPCEKKHVELKKLEADYKAEGRTYISTEWLEDCDIDGFYSQVQRNSNVTDGFCSDKFGKPLEDFQGDFNMMDCECAVVRNLTSQWGEKPSCTVDGSYRNQQCKGGKCYCVDRYGRQCEKEVDQSVTLDCTNADDMEDKAPELCPNTRKIVGNR
eukprot:GFUD01034655.1.p1 GENE.GFUD01034655.1~~GFUD01034655.1.p1  ORF type:complete len:486 (+),score=98.25 GFUD01034655.1:65-1459(+)